MLWPILLVASGLCDEAVRSSGLTGRACFAELARRTDDEMVAQWNETLKNIREEDLRNRMEKANLPSKEPGLLESQRTWLRYRDAECVMVSDQWAGGTGFSELGSLCRIELNQRRTIELKLRGEGRLVPNPI
ncbi:lysozyme inhibitor LprI family protein [Sphingobium sp. AN558]|uniref:lysozyme inhibitor LprI family protein n=1 Tax=Sphingobium sp. AN558 TaxID=3133442 RepID=UPI0040407E47